MNHPIAKAQAIVPGISEKAGATWGEPLMIDGIHLNAQGHAVWPWGYPTHPGEFVQWGISDL